MKKSFFSLIVAGLMILPSCAPIPEEKIAELKKPPVPQSKANLYSDALDKFGAMLIAYQNPDSTLYLLGKTVTNKTACGNLPMDISQMVATAVNRLGGKIRYIPYDPNYLVNEANLRFPVNRAVPALVIDGAITECDENLDNQNKGVNADVFMSVHGEEGSGSGGYDSGSNLTRIALDFHLMDYRTSALLPRIQSSFGADIRTLKGGYSFGLEALGSSVGFNSSRQFSQGKHEAVRTLVDVSILQLLGKYLALPYWRCLDGAKPDPLVISRLKNSFILSPANRRLATIQFLLRNFGYTNVSTNGVMDNATQQAIVDVASKSGGEVQAEVSPALYAYLYVNRPISLDPEFQSSTVMQQVALERQRLQARKQQQAQVKAKQQKAKRAKKKKKQAHKNDRVRFASGLETAIIYRPGEAGEFVLMSGGRLNSGTGYKLVVQPEKNCYLYVFQKDSLGRLYCLFPSNDRRDGLRNPLSAKVKQEFPGEGQYFYLDQNTGTERIYFYPVSKADPVLEQGIREINIEQIPDERKRQIEKDLIQYLATKDIVQKVETGSTFQFQGENGTKQGRMNRIPQLDNGKLYVFTFEHE